MLRDSLLQTTEKNDELSKLHTYTLQIITLVKNTNKLPQNVVDTLVENLYAIYKIDKDLAIQLLKDLGEITHKQPKLLNLMLVFSFFNHDFATFKDLMADQIKEIINESNLDHDYLNQLTSFIGFMSSTHNYLKPFQKSLLEGQLCDKFAQHVMSLIDKYGKHDSIDKINNLIAEYIRFLIAQDCMEYMDKIEKLIKKTLLE